MKHIDTTNFNDNERAVFDAMLRLCETNGDFQARYGVAEIVKEAGPGGARREALISLAKKSVLVTHADGREYSIAQQDDDSSKSVATKSQLVEFASDLNNWVPSRDLSEKYPQFTASQIKMLLWKREQHVGLSRCCSMVGARLYVNTKLFGLWLAGQLPEQNCQ